MPMLTTLRMRLPVWPSQAPDRTRSAKSAMRSRTSWTSGTTSVPSTSTTAARGARRATCSTARPSVTLIFSPANIASRSSVTSAVRARSNSNERVSSSSRCLA
jgi:hypothetical protein